MDDIWAKIKEQYPDIEETLDSLYSKQLELFELITRLEKDYPVEGYRWECDPNEIGGDMNPWYPVSEARKQEITNRYNEQLTQQLQCVDGKHHFVEIGGMKWCSYCGTLVADKKIMYPRQPHFLPKE